MDPFIHGTAVLSTKHIGSTDQLKITVITVLVKTHGHRVPGLDPIGGRKLAVVALTLVFHADPVECIVEQ
jgi:hypothetical protein